MRIYGLTGGIGSGKSEAAARFAERGIPVIDADKVAHGLLEPGGKAVTAVVEAFGPGIMTDDRIDRVKLGAVVFTDPEARWRLNAIVHPRVRHALANQCMALTGKGHKAAIVEAALLAEDGTRDPSFHGLIVVSCSPELRLQRLVETRGLTPEQARQRIEAQTPPEAKALVADWVIENEGTLEALRARVDEVADEIASQDTSERG